MTNINVKMESKNFLDTEIVIPGKEEHNIETKSDIESTGEHGDENESYEGSVIDHEGLIPRRKEQTANDDEIEDNNTKAEDEDDGDDDETPLFDYEYLKQPLHEGSNVTLAEAIKITDFIIL